jgi:organic radical activating enzyme
MSKTLILQGESGIAEASIEDLVSSKLNSFKGWNCSAGVENLYIDFDGYMWVANCASSDARLNYDIKSGLRPWGFRGNIRKEYVLPKTGVVCPYNSCGCGSDIVITKCKDSPTEFLKDNFTYTLIPLKNITSPSALKLKVKIPKQVLWDIGRRCNYSCSYCWPGVHNTTDPHKSLALLTRTADNIIDNWSEGNPIRWYFGGGEPTLNPDFEPFVEHLAQRNQHVMLVSNGSQGPSYWAKNADNYNILIFSAHFEFMKPELFTKNFSKVVEVIRNNPTRLEKIIVKLMTKPGEIQQSINFADSLKAEIGWHNFDDNSKHRVQFDMVPMRDIVDGSQLRSDYTQEDLDKVFEFNQQQPG